MKYWFKLVLYFFFVAIITYFVVFYSEAAKVLNFLSEQQDNVENDTLSFLAATVIANNDDGTDVYIEKTPLFEETYDSQSSSQHIKVSIYALVEFKNNQAHSSIVFLLRNIELNNDNIVSDKNNFQDLQANIVFDKTIKVNDYEASAFKETFVNAFDNKTKLLLINTDLFNTSEGNAEIKRIDITYSLTSGEDINFVTLYNSDIEAINPSDRFDSSFNRDIKNVTYDNINIFSTYGLNNFKDNADIYYNPNLLNELNDFSFYIRYILIEIAVVIIITYFIFFHKKVMAIYKNKKELKLKNHRAKQDLLVQKYKEQENDKEKKT